MRFKVFLEKSNEDNKQTLYIWADLPKDLHTKYLDRLELNEEDIIEVEDKPHMTFLYLPEPVEGITEEKAFDVIKPILEGKEFDETFLSHYEIFKGTSWEEDNDSDCVVVRLKVPHQLVEVRDEVKKALKDAGCTAEETFKEYKPHMTIAYVKPDTKVDLKDIDEDEVYLKNFGFQWGGSDKAKKRFI